MKATHLLRLFAKAGKRAHLVGDFNAGAIVGLDLEGRWFAILDGEVLNRVDRDAISGQSTRAQYLNPGGDGLWPAPEGSMFGYEYATGAWRVPPGLSGARYRVVSQEDNRVVVRAEIDLINDLGIGLPLGFQRDVSVSGESDSLRLVVTDSIEYLGFVSLESAAVRLAPWTLAQFDTSPGMEVVFPAVPAESVCDFYDPSDNLRQVTDDLWHVRTEGGQRFQVGLAPDVEWIELRIPERDLRVRRTARPLAGGPHYIDIADRPPDQPAHDFPCRYSIYNDAGSFMEIEAAGPGADVLAQHATVSHEVVTEFTFGRPA